MSPYILKRVRTFRSSENKSVLGLDQLEVVSVMCSIFGADDIFYFVLGRQEVEIKGLNNT